MRGFTKSTIYNNHMAQTRKTFAPEITLFLSPPLNDLYNRSKNRIQIFFKNIQPKTLSLEYCLAAWPQ